ncbi:hypothetical protein N7456_006550 [Penicillium angulare]|uniref:Uncharacterized protein n=1 Tax=Penicillium angulare TaxID=116970 RepID=A0A9W9KC13_9EURO|nr:hypothetical protein N7456_006550 [Penicillium angulare]
MPWKKAENSPNTFTRPLGPNEVFMQLVAEPGHALGHEHWAINYTATIVPRGAFEVLLSSPELLPTLIRYSWMHLRFQHPSIAACPDASRTATYVVPDSSDALNKWASKTFTVATDAKSADDVIPTIEPAADALLYFVPQSNQLLLHTGHWRTDGVGGTILLGQLVNLISSNAEALLSGKLPDPFDSFDWGSEVGRLMLPVEEAAKMPLVATDELKAIAQETTATFALAEGALGVPYIGDSTTVPAGTRAVELAFSPTDTSAAVSAAKARGFGITAAIHASMAAANFRNAISKHQDESRHYTSTIRQSFRECLPEPYSTPAGASGLYTSGWMASVDPSTTWEDNAHKYRTEYKKDVSGGYLQAHREYAYTLNEIVKNPPTPAEPPSDIDVSCIGVAEKYIEREYGTPERGFGITNVGLGVELLSRQATVFVWTFRDQLTLRLVYNESFHTAEQMSEFLKDVQTELLKQLNVWE